MKIVTKMMISGVVKNFSLAACFGFSGGLSWFIQVWDGSVGLLNS